ncbi:RelA/SpoT family protein [Campylobacter troglodytis]|uniref:RelA/SpoT family protein n=1 Tax=Campylobacter troglodytis TaxID=654363 RepID=UPI0011588768|nr:RelA/SpoT family protein [Campylobacter troglodytis]TQR60332.1 bifunctional (p)ppGpp synthase/hydrolase [Campylobacter troglodytis]
MRELKEELSLERLIERIKECKDLDKAKALLYEIQAPSERLQRAVDFCIKAHEGQKRKSGEPYSVHPILVASLVGFLSQNEAMILAALLHDVIEDTPHSEDELRDEFDSEVARLVRGLTKITELREDEFIKKAGKKLTKSALSFRNMLLASIEDASVLIIKLCDRFHNMLTLDSLMEEKRKRISEETLVVYAPIAHRLGISSLKNYLEDLSFFHLMPDEYMQIERFINSNDQKIQLGLNEFIDKIELLFQKNGFTRTSFEIHKRVKHNYSVYLKMQRKGIGIDEVLDLLGIRILVEDVSRCYMALGILHTNFNPLVSRFKDYIALPKQNGYQTIHTTLFDSKNIIEAQIRTFDMHKIAELGVAAHWRYKDGSDQNLATPKLDWLHDISMRTNIENSENYNAVELYEYAKESLYIEDIAVYSPKGEIFTLPRGATVLDFAYEVHTRIGLYAKAAYVNRVRVPLLTRLKNGDIVRIVTSNEKIYRCSWIDSVKTGKAKASIREFCRQKIKEVNLQASLNILSSVFKEEESTVLEWVEREGLNKKLRSLSTNLTYFKEIVAALKKYAKKSYLFDKYELKEQRFENITVHSNHKIANMDFNYCCHPKKGDEIIAFVENGNIILHHKFCNKADAMLAQKKATVFVEWSNVTKQGYKLIFSLENKKGALAEFLTTLSKMQANILSIHSSRSKELNSEYFEASMEFPHNIKIDEVKERLQSQYKILDFTSLNDAFKEKSV